MTLVLSSLSCHGLGTRQIIAAAYTDGPARPAPRHATPLAQEQLCDMARRRGGLGDPRGVARHRLPGKPIHLPEEILLDIFHCLRFVRLK
jgi:hypothetical protein